jgi:flagella basal body P-ring formation protein FlgA
MERPDAVAAAVQAAAEAGAPAGAVVSLGPVAGAGVMLACQGALQVVMSGVLPYEQAAARCVAPAWTLYVTVTVAQTAEVVVAARPVVAGQVLVAGDLMLAREPVAQYAGRQVFYDPAALLGANAVMSLATGMVLTSEVVNEPVVVKAGQTVTVRVISGAVTVTVTAVADQTGRIGETILLTNPSSGRRFSALVTVDGPVVRLQS